MKVLLGEAVVISNSPLLGRERVGGGWWGRGIRLDVRCKIRYKMLDKIR